VERFVGVEEARGVLGKLAEDVAEAQEPVWLTKRGQPLAALVGREEYTGLRQDASRADRAELAELLEQSRQRAAEAGLDTDSVDEAIAATRRLR
jgi:prevent-host-death family protein